MIIVMIKLFYSHEKRDYTMIKSWNESWCFYGEKRKDADFVEVVLFYIVPECFYLWGRICDHYPDEEKICR